MIDPATYVAKVSPIGPSSPRDAEALHPPGYLRCDGSDGGVKKKKVLHGVVDCLGTASEHSGLQ